MFNRRSFLLGSSSLALASLLSGCQGGKAALKVILLEGSIPPQFPGKFRSSLTQPGDLLFKPEGQLKKLYGLLKTWQEKKQSEETQTGGLPLISPRKPTIAHLVTLGDYWLAEAIRQELLQPLNLDKLSGWQNLPSRWQKLVRRNQEGKLDERGKIWGAPYRWGSTIIAYNQDKFKALGWQPTDWSDLWREELRGRISLLDQPREVIGLTLKKLGYSYNTPDLSQVPALKSELQALNKQVKFYSSENYLQPLILGHTWLAMGWSTDILPLQSRYRKIKAVIPRSGTSLWTDLWVRPKPQTAQDSVAVVSETNDLINQWVDFCWQPISAQQISLFTNAASPILLKLGKDNLDKKLRENQLLLADAQILENSEFLLLLSSETLKQYESLWREVRIS